MYLHGNRIILQSLHVEITEAGLQDEEGQEERIHGSTQPRPLASVEKCFYIQLGPMRKMILYVLKRAAFPSFGGMIK